MIHPEPPGRSEPPELVAQPEPAPTPRSPAATSSGDVRFACDGLRAGYGAVTIVPSFDLEVGAGTIAAILGPNGAGKTTLLTTMAGLVPAQAGAVIVDGRAITNGRPAAASRAGLVLVPDDRALFTTLTVDENLAAARGRRDTKPAEILDLFPALQRRRAITAGNLSGGEQQMLALARALMQEPRVLLIDEMSMGLAPIIVEDLLPTVRRVADETGAAIILVEQHVRLALEIADRALVLVHGRVSLDEPAAELGDDLSLLEAAYFGDERGGAASSPLPTSR
jgi:branched-chain amino acid transport system ATP-binding protein